MAMVCKRLLPPLCLASLFFLFIFSLSLGILAQTLPVAAAPNKVTSADLKSAPPSGSSGEANRLFNQGLQAYQKGRYTDAIAPLKRVIELKPKDEMALSLLGIVYLQLGSLNEAEAYFKRTLDVNSKNVDAYNNLSLVYYKQQRYEAAISELRESLSIQPNNADTVRSLASMYLEMGQTEEAIREYKRVIQLDPKSESAYTTLAHLFFQKNQLDEIVSLYSRADGKIARSSDALTNLGFTYLFKGDLKQAVKYFNLSNQANPSKPETHYGLGLINYKQANLDAAIQEFRQAVLLRKQYPDALRQLAISYEDKGEYIKALYYYHQLLKMSPDDNEAKRGYGATKTKAVDYYLRKGSEAYFQGDLKEAISNWEKVKKLDAENANAKKFIRTAETKLATEIKTHNDQAESYYLQSRFQDAYSEWKLVLKLDPKSETALAGIKKLRLKDTEKNEIAANQAINFASRGNMNAAMEALQGALKTDPTNKRVQDTMVKFQSQQKSEAEKYYRKGIELLSQDRIREAIEQLERALEIEPQNQQTKNLLYKARTQLRDNTKAAISRGIELANSGRVVEAKEKFNEVLKLDPGNSDAGEYLAKLTGSKGSRPAASKEEIKKLYYDGVSLYLDGQNRRAIQVWQKILLLDPENQEAKSSIAKAEMELKEMEKRGIKTE
jgi:tetratricopeptide (TPR) repeat protein